MAAEALHLSSTEASSGTTVTIALPSGPVTARIPPVRSGRILEIQTPQGARYLRVRVAASPGRLLMWAMVGLVLLVMVALGPGTLIASAYAPTPNPNAVPTCDDQPMTPSDQCQIIGSGHIYTYTEMQQRQAQAQAQSQASPGGLAAIGATFTGLDVAGVVIFLLKRRSVRRHPIPVRTAPAVLDRK